MNPGPYSRWPARPALGTAFLHMAAWVLVALLVLFALSLTAAQAQRPADMQTVVTALIVTLCISAPVYTALTAVDRLAGWLARAAGLSLALLLWTWLLHPVLEARGLRQSFGQDLLNFASVMGVALVVRAAWRGRRNQRLLREAERLRDAAEQRALSTQLSPHTLHNLINSLYAVSLSAPQRTPGLLLDLAGMFRHLAMAGERDFISACDEWAFMQACRTFALARASPASRVAMDFTGDDEEQVPPLLLASLFENALKHGITDEGELDVCASLHIAEGRLSFRVDNAVPARRALGVDAPAGLGYGNSLVQRRLAFHYPGRHAYNRGVREGRYVAEVTLW